MDYDRVKVDYACFIDGLSIDAFGAQDAYIFIGSGMMIDGFEEALIGMTLAEVRDIKLRFPDEYYSDLGGKEVTYSVTVKEICRVNEITDDVCKANTDYDSVEDMRSSIKRLVAAEYAYDKLFDEAKITKYPEAEYGRVYEDVTYIGTLAEKQKLSIEEYLKKYGDQFAEFGFFSGMTEEEYLENCDEYTKGVIKDEMVIYYLLRRMDVSTGGRAYRQMKERLLSEHKVADVANYEDLYGEGSFNSSMRYNLLLDALYDRVVFK